MEISGEGTIGIGLALLFAAGTGAAVMFPDQRWIGAVIIYIATVGLGVLALHHFGTGRGRMIPAVGMVVFGLAFLGCAGWYFWPAEQAAALPPLMAPPTPTDKEKHDGQISQTKIIQLNPGEETNSALKERAINFVASLRRFQENFDTNENRIMLSEMQIRRNATSVDLEAEMQRKSGEADQRRSAFRSEFMLNYRSNANFMYDALVDRLGKASSKFKPPASRERRCRQRRWQRRRDRGVPRQQRSSKACHRSHRGNARESARGRKVT